MARAMEHSLLARRLCLTLDIIVLQTRVRPYHIGPDSGMSSLTLASRPAMARNAHGARVGLSQGSDALPTLFGSSDRSHCESRNSAVCPCFGGRYPTAV